MSHIIHTNDTNKHEGTSLATSKEEKKEDFEIFTATDLANVVAYSTMAVGNIYGLVTLFLSVIII